MPSGTEKSILGRVRPQNGGETGMFHTARARRLAQMPARIRGIYAKGLRSKAAAIQSQCLECVGYSREDVSGCTDLGCPLWPHRPYQVKRGAGA